MSAFGDRLLTDQPRHTLPKGFWPLVLLAIPLLAILLQVFGPRVIDFLKFLEFPLLVTVYYALLYRQPIPGLLCGAGIGMMQDLLSAGPVGMFGIVKTLVGYFAASFSMRFDVENPLMRLILGYFFFFFHQFFHWVLARALLGDKWDFDLRQTALFGLLNAAIAVPLFTLLDKLKEKS